MEVESESHCTEVVSYRVVAGTCVEFIDSLRLGDCHQRVGRHFGSLFEADLVVAETVVVDTNRDIVGEEATYANVAGESSFSIVFVVVEGTCTKLVGDEEEIVTDTKLSIGLDDVSDRVTVLCADVDRSVDVVRIFEVGTVVVLLANVFVRTVPESTQFHIGLNLTVFTVVNRDTVAETECEAEERRRTVGDVLFAEKRVGITIVSVAQQVGMGWHFGAHIASGQTACERDTEFELCVGAVGADEESCCER